ncbi:MAG TPA: hypothetical protein VGT44_09505 [Ktedonobacteraceae bacterium]|nr:hypothetical protein [Ktedonobacteraceae bacterium]
MTAYTYKKVLTDIVNQIQQLSPEEQERLLDDLAVIIRSTKIDQPEMHSIKELRGLGKELWRGIDVEKYIEEERNSWTEESAHSLLDLEGLGAELWEGIDPQKYVEEERKAWRK